MPTKEEEEKKEIRAQRHDFIKEYYRMATMDLDRHLKSGWQTIAIVGGGVAILAAAGEGKIGMPVATTIALASAFWSALTVIDSNYWSVRAIAFLANVEAVYFSIEDRKHFNPYAGLHPPYKLLNSLAYMFLLSAIFAVATMLNLVWEVLGSYPTLAVAWAHFAEMTQVRKLIWATPFLVLIGGVVWTLYVWRKRLADYLAFCVGSPGPGMVADEKSWRLVTFEGATGITMQVVKDLQDGTVKKLRAAKIALDRLNIWISFAAVVLIAVVIGAALAS